MAGFLSKLSSLAKGVGKTLLALPLAIPVTLGKNFWAAYGKKLTRHTAYGWGDGIKIVNNGASSAYSKLYSLFSRGGSSARNYQEGTPSTPANQQPQQFESAGTPAVTLPERGSLASTFKEEHDAGTPAVRAAEPAPVESGAEIEASTDSPRARNQFAL